MSTRSIFLLALALGLGLFTSTVVYFQLTYTIAPPPVDMSPVVIAQRDLPARTRTTADDFTTRDYPRDALPPQAITKIEDAMDRTARVEIHAGDPVLRVLLADPGHDIAGELIPEGMRAFSIRVIDSSTMVEGLIRPGSKVDVCLSMRSQDQEDREEDGGGIARLLLQDIEILAVGKHVEVGKDKNASDRARSVTVIVKPEEANELALAQNHGALHLTLRGKGSEKVSIGRADLRQLRGDPPRPSPRSLGPVTNVVPQPVAVAPVAIPPAAPAPQFKRVDIDLIHGDRRSTSRLAFPVTEPVVESSDKRLD